MYDYIVVGAGSAGCVLASRLSEDPAARVLLLEAGGPDRAREIRIPAAFGKLFKGPYDWAYHTEPQPRLDGRALYWPRGKGLGGSSSINAMIYQRCEPANFDEWSALGNAGWEFERVRPYFRRVERRTGGGAAGDYGTDGPLSVSDLRSPNPLTRAFVAACEASGFERRDGHNDPDAQGNVAGLFHVAQRRGSRCSAAVAYLRPAMRRANLVVETGAHATGLRFDGNRAVGVTYVRRGAQREARTSGEVILAGGAISSPQLLLLSGIGPAAELEALDIPVRVDLPGVGENLQDHLVCGVAYTCTRPVSLAKAERPWHVASWLLFRRGPLTSNCAEAAAFLRTAAGEPVRDLEVIFGPVYFIEHGFQRHEGHGFSMGPVLVRPESRGRIRLRSADPQAAPAIDPNYLASDRDLARLVEGIERARALAASAPFDAYRGAEYLPGASTRARTGIEAFIRRTAETLYHPVGTCRMGTDDGAVLDPELRVRGVEGLRVIDASVMPTIVSGHPNAATMMIAERGADLVRGARPS